MHVLIRFARSSLAARHVQLVPPSTPWLRTVAGFIFSCGELEGTGQLVPKLTLLDRDSAVTGFEATLVSETGIQAALRNATAEIAVPVGKYRLCTRCRYR